MISINPDSREGVLIIGGSGFVGRHFQQQFSERYRIVATGREMDVRDQDGLVRLVAETEPQKVINLAAITTVRETIDRPRETYETGFLGMFNLLVALQENHFTGRLIQVSSSEVYGFPTVEQLPVKESEPFRPMSPYAVSKAASELLCQQWCRMELFEIITVRPFTHIGPGQSKRFAISNFTRQVANIMAGRQRPLLHVGNLEMTRDFTDVRDVVSAYEILLHKGSNGEVYNICSGREVRTGAILDAIISCSGQSIRIIQDALMRRGNEQKRVLGDFGKLLHDTGWRPGIPMQKTIADMLDYWFSASCGDDC